MKAALLDLSLATMNYGIAAELASADPAKQPLRYAASVELARAQEATLPLRCPLTAAHQADLLPLAKAAGFEELDLYSSLGVRNQWRFMATAWIGEKSYPLAQDICLYAPFPAFLVAVRADLEARVLAGKQYVVGVAYQVAA